METFFSYVGRKARRKIACGQACDFARPLEDSISFKLIKSDIKRQPYSLAVCNL